MVQKPPETKRKLLDSIVGNGLQVSRYALVGVGNTVTDFGVFALLFYAVQIFPLWANAIAFFIAVSQSYLLNSFWTFKIRKVTWSRYFSFVAISLGGLGLSTLSIFFLDGFVSPLIAKLLAAIAVLVWGYGLSRVFVFKVRQYPQFSNHSNL